MASQDIIYTYILLQHNSNRGGPHTRCQHGNFGPRPGDHNETRFARNNIYSNCLQLPLPLRLMLSLLLLFLVCLCLVLRALWRLGQLLWRQPRRNQCCAAKAFWVITKMNLCGLIIGLKWPLADFDVAFSSCYFILIYFLPSTVCCCYCVIFRCMPLGLNAPPLQHTHANTCLHSEMNRVSLFWYLWWQSVCLLYVWNEYAEFHLPSYCTLVKFTPKDEVAMKNHTITYLQRG